MSDEATPENAATESAPKVQEQKECLRCHKLKPVDDDGFCEPCAKAIEQACM